MHRNGRADRALGIVLVCDRSAEDRHDGVADVLVDRPAVALDLVRERAEERRQDPPEVLGVEALGERRGAGDVGEQHRDQSAILTQVNGGLVGDLKGGAAQRLCCWRLLRRSRTNGGAAIWAEAVRRAQHTATRHAAQARRSVSGAAALFRHWPNSKRTIRRSFVDCCALEKQPFLKDGVRRRSRREARRVRTLGVGLSALRGARRATVAGSRPRAASTASAARRFPRWILRGWSCPARYARPARQGCRSFHSQTVKLLTRSLTRYRRAA